MEFESNNQIKKIGEKIGFFISMLIFCSIFYLILSLTHKISRFIQYYQLLLGIIIFYMFGLAIIWLLKKISKNKNL